MSRDLSKNAPWEEFPLIPWGSIGWRMGEGEEYWCSWKNWYQSLSQQSRQDYQKLHPEPQSWNGFYEYMNK